MWDFDADGSEFSQIGGDLIDGDFLVLFVADLAEIFERKGDGDLDGLGAFESYDTTTCCDKSPVGRGSLGDTRIKRGVQGGSAEIDRGLLELDLGEVEVLAKAFECADAFEDTQADLVEAAGVDGTAFEENFVALFVAFVDIDIKFCAI